MSDQSIIPTIQSATDDRNYILRTDVLFDDYDNKSDPQAIVIDQGNTPNCAPSAFVRWAQWKHFTRTGEHRKFSVRFLNYCAHKVEGTIGQPGVGLSIHTVLKCAKNIGLCDQALCPDDPALAWTIPSDEAFANAASQRLIDYYRVPMGQGGDIDGLAETIRNVKSAHAQGYLVIIGLTVYEWLRHVKGNISQHSMLDTSIPGYNAVIGGHALLSQGHEPINGGIIPFANSWTEGYADHGTVGLPETIVRDAFEIWAPGEFITAIPPKAVRPPLDYLQYYKTVAALYAALFNRAPDFTGMSYWGTQMIVKTPAQIADEMYWSSDARPYFPLFATPVEQIGACYTNLLGRYPEFGGLKYWSDRIVNGETFGTVIWSMIETVLSYEGSGKLEVFARELLMNKLAVGLHCAVDKRCNDIPICQHALDGVTDDYGSVAQALARIDGVTA